jgi:hypothetical protein
VSTAVATFFSLDTLKQHLTIQGVSKDDLLTRIADSVSLTFERETRRRYVIRPFTEHLNGRDSRELYLTEYPVTALTLLRVYRYSGQATPDTLTLGAGYHRLVSDQGLVLLAQDTFTRGRANVEATYSAGYFAKDSGGGDAAQIYTAALDLCQLLWQEQSTGAMAASQVTIGPMGFPIKTEWPKHILAALRDWKRPRL